MQPEKATTIDQYIAGFPEATRVLLEQMRTIIQKAAPQAKETISYAMPAFKQNGVLVYFAAYDRHIGFYPTGTGIAHFKEEISAFKHSKGAVQFPLDQKLPAALITRIVKFKVSEDLLKTSKPAKKAK